jgi:hypothetical protein
MYQLPPWQAIVSTEGLYPDSHFTSHVDPSLAGSVQCDMSPKRILTGASVQGFTVHTMLEVPSVETGEDENVPDVHSKYQVPEPEAE